MEFAFESPTIDRNSPGTRLAVWSARVSRQGYQGYQYDGSEEGAWGYVTRSRDVSMMNRWIDGVSVTETQRSLGILFMDLSNTKIVLD
jgi:hypothetical protein